MADDLHLDDADDPRSVALVREGNEAVAARLEDERFAEDVALLKELLEDEDKLFVCRLRAGHLYDFHRSADHPRGLWRRVRADVAPSADAPWEPVFDLDAYCAEHGEWAWRGPVDGPDPSRVMLVLSDNGSDVCVAKEFDLATKSFVEDGFATPPARLSLHWDTADALLVSAATGPDHAVRSGWPKTTRLWERGTAFGDAPVIHAVGDEDLYASVQRIFETDVRVFDTAHTIQTSSLEVERGGRSGRSICRARPTRARRTASPSGSRRSDGDPPPREAS